MVLFRNIAIFVVATMSFSPSQNLRISHSGRRNGDVNLQKLYDLLIAQDEKINRLHALAVTNQFMTKCTTLISGGNIDLGGKCWKDMISEIKTYDQSAATEVKLLSELITNTYNGEKTRLPHIVQFIRANVEKGSDLAYSTYNTLLNEMDYHGQLYMKKIVSDGGFGVGLVDFTYRTLIAIDEAEGETSPIFSRNLPVVLNSILKEKEIFIRNSVTKDFLHASRANSNNTKVRLSSSNDKDARYTWKMIAAESEWNKNNRELFYIKNGDRIMAVDDHDGGSLIMADATAERLKSTWAMFYIRFVRGTSGEEVTIQCSYWGIKTLALDEQNSMPKLLTLDSLESNPSAIWLLQPKVN